MDDDDLNELYRLRRTLAGLRAYLIQKRTMWGHRAEKWPKNVKPTNLAKNLVAAYDKLLEMTEE